MGAITPKSARATEKELKAKADALIDQMQADLAALPAATTADLKLILGRVIQNQIRIVRFLKSRL